MAAYEKSVNTLRRFLPPPPWLKVEFPTITCSLLSVLGARHLVLIDHISTERMSTAGVKDAAVTARFPVAGLYEQFDPPANR